MGFSRILKLLFINLEDNSELEIQISQQNTDYKIEIVKVIEIVQRKNVECQEERDLTVEF